MQIKSLLLGSAAALVAVSGARAADAIIVEPEPVEYVRVCDVYGAGFFYIPGTETCLKLGGYVRFELRYTDSEINDEGDDYSFSSFARFAPTWDVRSESEWGTVRAFAELEFDYDSYATDAAFVLVDDDEDPTTPDVLVLTEGAGAQSTNLNHAYIELINAGGTLRLGKGDTPYARFLGYGSGNVFGLDYGFNNNNEISYLFNGGGGFSGIIALVEDNDGTFMPNVEAGVNFAGDWGSIGGIVAYDNPNENFFGKVVLRANNVFGSAFSAGLHVFYSEGEGAYDVVNPVDGGVSEWSVAVHGKAPITETIAFTAQAQWFDEGIIDSDGDGGGDDEWQFAAGFDMNPVPGLRIRPEARYTTGSEVVDVTVRFDRAF